MVALYNILWILFAYLLGSINFSIILTKFNSKKEDIRKMGSGNAGATNAMRVHGFKFGLIVFILDTSKSFWLGLALGLMQSKSESFSGLMPQLILLFVIIGHIFPIYFKFKGGKGAATLLGMIASISLILAIIGTILFFLIVGITRYVSLGSITIPFIIALLSFICPYFNHIDTTITYGQFWINPLFLSLGSIIVAVSHWQNILRLVKHKESKINFKFEPKNKNNTDDINIKKQVTENKIVDKNISIIDDATNLNNFD